MSITFTDIKEVDPRSLEVGTEFMIHTDGKYRLHRVIRMENPPIVSIHVIDLVYEGGGWKHKFTPRQYINIFNTLIELDKSDKSNLYEFVHMGATDHKTAMLLMNAEIKKANMNKRMYYNKYVHNNTLGMYMTLNLSNNLSIRFKFGHEVFEDQNVWLSETKIFVKYKNSFYSIHAVNAERLLRHLYEMSLRYGWFDATTLRKMLDCAEATSYDIRESVEDSNKEMNVALMASILMESTDEPHRDRLFNAMRKMYDPIYVNPQTKFAGYVDTVRLESRFGGPYPLYEVDGKMIDRSILDHHTNMDAKITHALIEIDHHNSSTSKAIHPIHGIPYNKSKIDNDAVYYHMPDVGTYCLRSQSYIEVAVFTHGYYLKATREAPVDKQKFDKLMEHAKLTTTLMA